jgi:hypothetical protein
MTSSLKEIPISWNYVFKIWFSLLWWSLVFLVLVVILCGSIGFVLGYIMGLFGIEQNVILLICGVGGFVTALPLSVIPIKTIVGKNFGKFKLTLLDKEKEMAPSWNVIWRIWWAYGWRNLVFGFVIGFIIGFLGAFLHIDQTISSTTGLLLSVVAGFLISVVSLKMIIGKKFGTAQLTIVSD